MVKTFEFGGDFLEYPLVVNAELNKLKNGDKLVVHFKGQDLTDEAIQAYCELMDKFSLPLAFYPYCECMGSANRVFANPNPIVEVKLLTGNYINLVRHLNFGVVFYDVEQLQLMRFRMSAKSAFFEDLIDQLSSINALISNGLFIDVHESWKYFLRYRSMPLVLPESYRDDLAALKLTLDNDVTKILNFIYNIDLNELESEEENNAVS